MSLGDGGLTSSSEVDAYVEQVVSRIRTTPPKESGEPAECPALDLGPLLLRLPGETWHWKRIWKSGQGWMQKNWPIWTTIIHNQLDWLLYNFIYHICVHPRIHSTQTRTLYYMSLAESIQTTYILVSVVKSLAPIQYILVLDGVLFGFEWFWHVLSHHQNLLFRIRSQEGQGMSRDPGGSQRITLFLGILVCSLLRAACWEGKIKTPTGILLILILSHCYTVSIPGMAMRHSCFSII